MLEQSTLTIPWCQQAELAKMVHKKRDYGIQRGLDSDDSDVDKAYFRERDDPVFLLSAAEPCETGAVCDPSIPKCKKVRAYDKLKLDRIGDKPYSHGNTRQT